MQAKVEAPASEPLSDMGTSVALRGVVRRYRSSRREPVAALAGVDLHVGANGVLGVVGPSGCGKSTLLELLAGLQEPDEGSVEVSGRGAARARRDLCAFMPQRDMLLPWRDALGNAALGLECRGMASREARGRAAPLLERFGLGGFERARPDQLSGGMRQRVAFLRTLLPGRPVLLLDEPFASLDSISRASMQTWLADTLAAEPRTVILVTHDVEEALFLSDRVAVLSGRPGRVLAELDVAIPRPRDRRAMVTDPEMARLRERAMEVLGS